MHRLVKSPLLNTKTCYSVIYLVTFLYVFLSRVPLDDLLELCEDVCLCLSPEHIAGSVLLDWRLCKVGLTVFVSWCCKSEALFFMRASCPFALTYIHFRIFLYSIILLFPC